MFCFLSGVSIKICVTATKSNEKFKGFNNLTNYEQITSKNNSKKQNLFEKKDQKYNTQQKKLQFNFSLAFLVMQSADEKSIKF